MAPPPLPIGSFGVSPSSGPAPGLSTSLGHTPSSSPFASHIQLPAVARPPDVFRALNEVVPLDECDVYSWFPEPEYDPHAQGDDDDESDDEYGLLPEADIDEHLDLAGDMDIDLEPAWGHAGMELDDIPTATPMGKTRSSQEARRKSMNMPSVTAQALSRSEIRHLDDGAAEGRRVGGLLWSSNYFFYSK